MAAIFPGLNVCVNIGAYGGHHTVVPVPIMQPQRTRVDTLNDFETD